VKPAAKEKWTSTLGKSLESGAKTAATIEWSGPAKEETLIPADTERLDDRQRVGEPPEEWNERAEQNEIIIIIHLHGLAQRGMWLHRTPAGNVDRH
jgi:hypothetical protein